MNCHPNSSSSCLHRRARVANHNKWGEDELPPEFKLFLPTQKGAGGQALA